MANGEWAMSWSHVEAKTPGAKRLRWSQPGGAKEGGCAVCSVTCCPVALRTPILDAAHRSVLTNELVWEMGSRLGDATTYLQCLQRLGIRLGLSWLKASFSPFVYRPAEIYGRDVYRMYAAERRGKFNILRR